MDRASGLRAGLFAALAAAAGMLVSDAIGAATALDAALPLWTTLIAAAAILSRPGLGREACSMLVPAALLAAAAIPHAPHRHLLLGLLVAAALAIALLRRGVVAGSGTPEVDETSATTPDRPELRGVVAGVPPASGRGKGNGGQEVDAMSATTPERLELRRAAILLSLALIAIRAVPFDPAILPQSILWLAGSLLLLAALSTEPIFAIEGRLRKRDRMVSPLALFLTFGVAWITPSLPWQAALVPLAAGALVHAFRHPAPVAIVASLGAAAFAGRWMLIAAGVALAIRVAGLMARGNRARVVPTVGGGAWEGGVAALAFAPAAVAAWWTAAPAARIASAALLLLSLFARPLPAVLLALLALLLVAGRSGLLERRLTIVSGAAAFAGVAALGWSGALAGSLPGWWSGWMLPAIAVAGAVALLLPSRLAVVSSLLAASVAWLAWNPAPGPAHSELVARSLAAGESAVLAPPRGAASLDLVLSGANLAGVEAGVVIGEVRVLEPGGSARARSISIGQIADWGAFREEFRYRTRNPLPSPPSWIIGGEGRASWLHGSGVIELRGAKPIGRIVVQASEQLPEGARLQIDRMEVPRSPFPRSRESWLLGGLLLVTSLAPWVLIATFPQRLLWWDAGLSIVLAFGLPLAERLAAPPPPLLLVAVAAAKLLLLAVFVTREADVPPARIAAFSLVIFAFAAALMAPWPIDGDEPYYVLVAESILHDGDLDLRNQYEVAAEGGSVTGRPDLAPQPGDPVAPGGAIRSRHAPLLPLLLVPGVALAGLPGALATMALLAALAVASIARLLEEAGLSRRARVAAWLITAFLSPFLFYAARIWPEAPAALCLSEALRAGLKRKAGRSLVFLLLLSLLKLRFLAIALPLAAIVLRRAGVRRRWFALAAAGATVPLLLAWGLSGTPLNVHHWRELVPWPAWKYLRGAAGLLVDAQGGMLLQAPLWLAGLFGLVASGRRSEAARWGVASAALYMVLLLPRDEWHGGWSPPLRYLVVFAPLFALGLAAAIERWRGWLPLPLGAALLVSIHGLAWPWRLFEIASGESQLGAWLSSARGADLARMLPSLIRPNAAAPVATLLLAAIAFVAVVMARRGRTVDAWGRAAAASALVAIVLVAGMRPGSVVHFEDAHVAREGGTLYPERWTVARFLYDGGWTMNAGDAVRFRMQPGRATLRASAPDGAMLRLGEREVLVPPQPGWQTVPVTVDSIPVELRVDRGSVVVERIDRE